MSRRNLCKYGCKRMSPRHVTVKALRSLCCSLSYSVPFLSLIPTFLHFQSFGPGKLALFFLLVMIPHKLFLVQDTELDLIAILIENHIITTCGIHAVNVLSNKAPPTKYDGN